MKTSTQKVIQFTGMHSEEYERVVFKTYLMCMHEVSKTPQHLQMLLVNRPINKWFLRQVEKLNQEFIKDNISFKGLKKIYLAAQYKKAIVKIKRNYPSALVDQVKI
ncbi:conserved hypothetical protein [Tenacibaculum maritimum]|nr:hypothetical protein [Tenacibaculum maritimum]CAA0247869.1 conserved hypothetical protein [Tenacibaculum maritimum]